MLTVKGHSPGMTERVSRTLTGEAVNQMEVTIGTVSGYILEVGITSDVLTYLRVCAEVGIECQACFKPNSYFLRMRTRYEC